MSLTRENLKSFLERETVSDFINLESYDEIDDIGIYFCQNGYRGFAIELFPSSFAGMTEFETIVSYLGYDFPVDTFFEIFMIPSRNIDSIMDRYEKGHNKPEKVSNPEAIKKLISKNASWIKSNRDTSLVDSPLVDLRPKNIRVFVSVLIPPINTKTKEEISDEKIIQFANISKGKLFSLSPSFMYVDELMSLYNEMLRPYKGKEWDMQYDSHTPIYNQFLSSEDEFGVCEEDETLIESFSKNSERYYSAVLTTKHYPRTFNIIGAQNLFFDMTGREPKNHFSGPYYISLKIAVEDKERLKKIQVSKAQANRYQSNLFGEKIKTYIPKLAEISEESADLISRLDSKGDIILKSQYAIVMSDNNINTLLERVESAKTDFEKVGWILQQETEIAHILYLYTLPFSSDPAYKNYSKRFDTMLKSNNGAIAPLYKGSGSMGGPEKGTVFFDRQGQIQFFDNFEKGRPGNNIVVAAGTRSGKTYMITNKILSDVAATRKAVFIELEETLSDVTEAVGGEYIRFDEKNVKKCLNFFTNIKTLPDGSLDPESLHLIVPLVGLMINWNLDADESKIKDPNVAVMSSYVAKAIKAAYKEAEREAGMAEVYTNLELIYKELQSNGINDERLRDAVTSLEPYAIRGGIYYEFFNGKRNIYFSGNNFTGIGLSALKEKGDLFSIVLMALTQAIVSEYYDESKKHIEKLLYIDEAWSLLENPIFVMFLIRVWRTINKYNGAGVAISQDVDQYFKTPELEAIYNNSTYKIFFQQPVDVVERMMRDKKIPEDTVLKNSITSLRTVTAKYSEMMIYTNSGFSINRMITNKYTFYLVTNADNGKEVFALMKELSIKKYEASEILAHKFENKCSLKASVEIFYYTKGKTEKDSLSKEAVDILFPKKENKQKIQEKEEPLSFLDKTINFFFG